MPAAATEICPACHQPIRSGVAARAHAVSVRCGLTERQLAVVMAVLEYQERTGTSPSLRTIGPLLQVSYVTVGEHVQLCIKKGAMKRTGGARTSGLKVIE